MGEINHSFVLRGNIGSKLNGPFGMVRTIRGNRDFFKHGLSSFSKILAAYGGKPHSKPEAGFPAN